MPESWAPPWVAMKVFFRQFLARIFFHYDISDVDGARLSHERTTVWYTLEVIKGNAVSVHSVGSESLLYGLILGLLRALHVLLQVWCCWLQREDGVLQTGLGTELAEESV